MVSDGAAISFNRRVMSHPHLYNSYLRLLTSFARGELDRPTVTSELQTLFKGHDDLLYGCPIFLPPQSLPPQFTNNAVVADMDKLKSSITFQNKLENRFADNQAVICAYLKTIKALTKSELSNNEAYDTVAKIFGNENQDLIDEFASVLKIKKRKREEENVSSPSSSSSEKIKAKRQKTAEDDIFEIDVHLSRMRTTVESTKALMNILRDSTQQHQIVDKCLGDLCLSCIRKEYKEEGFFIIKRLREDPQNVLPQILSKLMSKKKELIESKEKLLKRWHEAHQQEKILR